MIVEPAPIHARSLRRRVLRAAGFVLPVALLVGAIGIGLAGPAPTPPPIADASPAVGAVATPPASPSGVPASPPSAPAPAQPAFPAAFRSLPALRPSAVLAVRATAAGVTGVVAVAGYLGLAGSPARCAIPPANVGAWCDRAGTLSDAPFASLGGGVGGRPPHLHVVVPAGVVLPREVEATAGAVAGTAVPAVVLGRFAMPVSCAGRPSACERGFVVDRVVWVAGRATALVPLVEPGHGAGTPAAPIGDAPASLTLVAVLARPGTIARLDPPAGAATRAIRPRPGLVWYLRVLEGLNTATPAARWLVLDATGRTSLASGAASIPRGLATSDPSGAGAAASIPPGG